MNREEFKTKYNKQLNLDNKIWGFPPMAVVGWKSPLHSFYVQVSLKHEIVMDYLYYFKNNNLYELHLSYHLETFLNKRKRESLDITEVTIKKLTALKIPSRYLTKVEVFDETNSKDYFNNVGFPVKDDVVKPIDEYLNGNSIVIDGKSAKIKRLTDPYLSEVFYEMPRPDNLEKDWLSVNTLSEDVKKYPKFDVSELKGLYSDCWKPKTEPITKSEIDLTIENRINHCKELLKSKSTEYHRNKDQLHNFQVAAALTGECREKALWGMAIKHIISIQDIVFDMNNDKDYVPDKKLLDDKITDGINYLLLLEASIEKKRNKIV